MNDLVLVAGGGAMGAGIAFVAAQGGYRVEVVEPDAGARDKARARIARSADRAGDASIAGRDRLSRCHPGPKRRRGRNRSRARTNRTQARGPRRARIGDRAGRAAGHEYVVALRRRVGRCSRRTRAGRRPALLQSARGNETARNRAREQTSDDSLERAYAFAERIGKTAVSAADTPGFIVNRVARPYYLQAMRALEGGVASVEELDALARAGGFSRWGRSS